MSVYIFSLVVGWTIGGIDHAQGYRAQVLKGHSNLFKYVFAELPRRREIELYKSLGIDISQMVSVHQHFTDNRILRLSVKAESKVEELKEKLNCIETEYLEKSIKLKRNGSTIAELLLDEYESDYIYAVYYYKREKLIRAEVYTDRVLYVNYYMTAKMNDRPYAKLVRRVFYNRDGSVAYNQLFKGAKEIYLFPNGDVYTNEQFVAEYIKSLQLSEKDIVFIDRGISQCGYMQALFQYRNHARILVFFHSEHFYEIGQSGGINVYWNWDYLYWFKYSKLIHTMIVSTKEQKELLKKKFQECNRDIPNIRVIPVGGVEHLRYPKGQRKKYSLITVSRIAGGKGIELIVKCVIKAHQLNPYISIDIYGGIEGGNQAYYQELQKMVSENEASSYIRFMGHQDVSEVYKNYEVYLSGSKGETWGLSIMEAVASGNAMIGLDVRYGNRQFIHTEENGYLIDVEWNYNNSEMMNKVVDDMTEKVIEIFSDEQRLERFHQKSYEIAEKFSSDIIAEQWKELLM